ncbi:amidohydrolase family protein [Polymorphospora rubra]|uniref:amidohydrolase family protein n=1 Tax=Polymorphospora rubra TaxID=338584 RepID=UPI003402F777
MSTLPAPVDVEIVDLHTHYRPHWWDDSGLGRRLTAGTGPGLDYAKLDDIDDLTRETDAGGIALRALSAPVELLFGPGVDVPTSAVRRVNEHLRQIVDDHTGRFVGLATVDAYAGDAGAEEARYAIEELGLHGLVLDSSRHDLYVGSPQVRPTLEVAAAHRVPVFVHPVFAPHAGPLVAAAGRDGNSFGRGLTNGTSFLSVLHAGLPELLPDLHLVFTALGAGSLLFAADRIAEYAGSRTLNVYFDTLRFHPPTLRYLVDVLGAERVVVGSDWPIRLDGRRPEILAALGAAGLSPTEQALVAGGNARRLLTARTPATAPDEEGS